MQGKRKTKVLIIVVIISIILVGGIAFVFKNEKPRFSDIGVELVEIKELEMPAPEEKEFGFSTNDWTSFEVAIDGEIYIWPISYSQLVDNSFVIKKDDSIDYEQIEEKYDTWGHTMYNKDQTVFISIAFDGYVMPDYEATDCHAYTLSVVKGFTKDYDDFVLCNGIRLDDHYNDVVAAMGKEVEKSYYEGSGDDRFSVSYENNTRKIQFTFVDNRLERIEMYDLK